MSRQGVFCHKSCHIVFVTPITVHVTTTFTSQQCVQCSVTYFLSASTVEAQNYSQAQQSVSKAM